MGWRGEGTTYCHAFNLCCRNAVSVWRRTGQLCFQPHWIAALPEWPPVCPLLAGLLLFFFSCLLGPESWDEMESARSSPLGVSAIAYAVEDGLTGGTQREGVGVQSKSLELFSRRHKVKLIRMSGPLLPGGSLVRTFVTTAAVA